jgi:hypothetical protein
VAAGVEDEDHDDNDNDVGEDGPGDADARSASPGGFDPNRRLCPDGSCVGVIGAEGICTVCGQKAD